MSDSKRIEFLLLVRKGDNPRVYCWAGLARTQEAK